MKRMSRFGAALVMAGMVASGFSVTTVRLEAKGKNDGGDISTLCNVLLSVINDTSLNQAIRDAAQAGFDLLGCS
jgi:hypothetical protein